jgi:hypothetical protein
MRPGFQLRFGRQFTVEKEICNFQIGALLSKLIYRIAPIFEDSFVAINERDPALA